MAFYEALQKYGTLLKKRYLKFSDIRFRDDIILSEKEIESAFYSIESQGSLASKLDILKRHLLQRVERIQQSQKGKPWVEKEMIAMSDLDLYRYEKETHNQKAMEEAMTADILEDAFEPIVARIEALAFIRYKNQYIHFLRAVPKLLSLDAFGLDEDEWRSPHRCGCGTHGREECAAGRSGCLLQSAFVAEGTIQRHEIPIHLSG